MVRVFVENDIDRALKKLRKKIAEDGDQKRLRDRRRFAPRNARRRSKAKKAAKKRRK